MAGMPDLWGERNLPHFGRILANEIFAQFEPTRPKSIFKNYSYIFKFYFYYSHIINFTITILLSLFLPSSLSLLLLCYNPLFSLPTTLSAPSHPLFTSPSYPSLSCHHNTPPSYTLITH
jgi:hypothetical protein